MIKISALNEESNEESCSEEDVTREALEQIALQQYRKSLELQRKGDLNDALQLLKDLLDTELLDSVKKPEKIDEVTSPLFNLKYLSYKNAGNICTRLEKYDDAIEMYYEASKLDDKDITLWYRFGCVCYQGENYDLALQTFRKGYDFNSRHWPTIDKLITLLLGLEHYNECIEIIYKALELDSDYIRAKVYRNHIYTKYPYVLEYMSYKNKLYKWSPECDPPDETISEKLLNEADIIHKKNLEQYEQNNFVYKIPHLKLQKPINELSWISLCNSLVHMHNFMNENCYSHASTIELIYDKQSEIETMEVCDEPTAIESSENSDENTDSDKVNNDNNVSESENNEMSDKNITDTEKVESDQDVAQQQTDTNRNESKEQKKSATRRRGSELSILEPWEWYTKRRSARKKVATKADKELTIYDILRRLFPSYLNKESDKKTEIIDDNSISEICKFINERENQDENNKSLLKEEYYGTFKEQGDIKSFIEYYTQNTSDIITMLKDVLTKLSNKWHLKFPDGLKKLYIECDNCCMQHFDKPTYFYDNFEDLFYFASVNLLKQEIELNEKYKNNSESEFKMDIIDLMGMYINKPDVFAGDTMVFYLRYLWLKANCYFVNENFEACLDCLYKLKLQFEMMGDEKNKFKVEIPNFESRSSINIEEVENLIEMLERNKRLENVMPCYTMGNFEEALAVIMKCYDVCKKIADDQKYEKISLDWAIQLSLIVDCYFALNEVENTFKWAVTGLIEAFKHYLRFKPGNADNEKWSLTVVKMLVTIDHIIKTFGVFHFENLNDLELSELVETLIQIVGHQVEENNVTELPIDTVVTWIILHYILQREEDHGRDRKVPESDKTDEIPNAISVLFIGHEYLGRKSWCCNSNGALLYFILDTVIPRLRSPALSRSVELICQYLEQCVFCLFGHPSKKTKLKYLIDHNVTPHSLDWNRAQQLYEIYRPADLPEIEGKVPAITTETEQLFQRMLSLLPTECDPRKYVPEMMKFIEGKLPQLPVIPTLLPYKIKDIYYFLGEYYFKRDERSKSIKYNLYDVIVNNDRFESWAGLALAKSSNLEVKVNSCDEIKNDMDYLIEAEAAERCFRRALHLDPMHCTLWIEYGAFVYSLHSFCSRLLKQASESLSMEDFEPLEMKKEYMLETAQECFSKVTDQLNESDVSDDSSNDEMWLHYYMLGKISEKKSKLPSDYLAHYTKAAKCLLESKASYPAKINYNTPQHLALEAMEVQYRIHASILKYMEQHENKVVHESEVMLFLQCIEECANGPFGKKKLKGENSEDQKSTENSQSSNNVNKRPLNESGDDSQENKRPRLENGSTSKQASLENNISQESTAEEKQSASESQKIKQLTTEVEMSNPTLIPTINSNNSLNDINITTESQKEIKQTLKEEDVSMKTETDTKNINSDQNETIENLVDEISVLQNRNALENTSTVNEENNESLTKTSECHEIKETNQPENKAQPMETEERRPSHEGTTTTSNSTTDSSSDDSSDSSSNSSTNSNNTIKEVEQMAEEKPADEQQIMSVITGCLDALEDCVSRFPQHYKALFRLTHYHFYYKKGKDIERCRDLMLSSFISRNGQKLQGLFSERKNNNFFNNIWRIPANDIDRPGSFACHMGRCVLITMEILKEIDDHKTLLDLSLQLHKTPEPDKKYLKDSERKELAQQACSLCIQSLKGQLTKFSQQEDLKSNAIELKAFNSLMLDIYRAYQRVQKQQNAKFFTNLLIEGYKLVSNVAVNENINFVDLSMKYCQAVISSLKQQATTANAQKGETKKNAPKLLGENNRPNTIPKQKSVEQKIVNVSKQMSAQEINNTLSNYINEQLTQKTAAMLTSLSYMNSLNALQNTAAINSFQSEYCRQIINLQMLKPKPPKKSNSTIITGNQTANQVVNTLKSKSTPKIHPTSTTKQANLVPTSSHYSSSLTKSINNSVSIPSFSNNTTKSFDPKYNMKPAHTTSTSGVRPLTGKVLPALSSIPSTVSTALQTKPPLPLEQLSPGKTLQEKLAEKQKNISSLKSTNAISTVSMSYTNGNKSKEPHKKITEVKRSLHFEKEKLAKPKKVIDSSEIIVLDDDDD